MAFEIIKNISHAEWLEYRKQGIGSSEVGTILGINPYETPLQLWRRKLGIDPPKEENFAMKAGHILEDAVAKFYADATGKEIIKSSAGDWLMRDAENTFLQVSPDRTFWIPGRTKSNANKGILECKTTSSSVDADDMPKRWFCQLMYQLGVAGYECGAIAWLSSSFRGFDFGYKEIDFDPDFYNFEVEQIKRFWVDNIIGRKEPDPVSVSDLLLKYPKHQDGVYLEAGLDIANNCNQLKELKEDIDKLSAEKEKLETLIKIAIGEAEGLTYNGDKIVTWKAGKDKQTFDAKALQAADPETYQKYIKTTPGVRTFRLK